MNAQSQFKEFIGPNNERIPIEDVREWRFDCPLEEMPGSWSNTPGITRRSGPEIITTLTLRSGRVVKWSDPNPGYLS